MKVLMAKNFGAGVSEEVLELPPSFSEKGKGNCPVQTLWVWMAVCP